MTDALRWSCGAEASMALLNCTRAAAPGHSCQRVCLVHVLEPRATCDLSCVTRPGRPRAYVYCVAASYLRRGLCMEFGSVKLTTVKATFQLFF